MTALRVWAERALTPSRELERVRLVAVDGRIAEVQSGVAPEPADEAYPGATLVPGLVDLQVNGGAGAAYDSPDPVERARATAHHVQAGTTSLLATLVSAPIETLEVALRALCDEVDPAGPVVGVHLEGPFLADEKAGAHDRTVLSTPTPERVERLLNASDGALVCVTLAPELPGALAAIERLRRAGVVVAAGHSRATLGELRAAVERGLAFVTHVGNASDWPSRPLDPVRGFRASEPGLVGGFLVEPRVRGSVIADGVHLHPELIRALVELRGDDSVVLVSDATPASGLEPGRYRIGGLDATVREDGVATAGEGLAGSTIVLADAVRTVVRECRLSLASAVRMATSTPADVIGRAPRKGSLEPGSDADLLLLGGDLETLAVYRAARRA